MNRPSGSSALKRKTTERESPRLTDVERAILNAIEDRKESGIWVGNIKRETRLTDHVVQKSLKSLLDNNLIRAVVNIQNRAKKHYVARGFEPSKEVTGGEWYDSSGSLDKEYIDTLKRFCLNYVRELKVATSEKVHDKLKKNGVFKSELSSQQVSDTLYRMVLDNDLIEVKSTVGTVCYRVASSVGVGKVTRLGALASIPCGACPRISVCTPNGVVSPSTCVYYSNWLDIDF